MAGGTVITGELWIPGQKIISIPSGKRFKAAMSAHDLFQITGHNIRYIGPEYETVPIKKLLSWLIQDAPEALIPKAEDTPHMLSLAQGYRIENPEHLVEGILAQDRQVSEGQIEQREYWSCVGAMEKDVLVTDKVYQPDYYSATYTPEERTREDEDGLKGWR